MNSPQKYTLNKSRVGSPSRSPEFIENGTVPESGGEYELTLTPRHTVRGAKLSKNPRSLGSHDIE